jgi:hypothetical protein
VCWERAREGEGERKGEETYLPEPPYVTFDITWDATVYAKTKKHILEEGGMIAKSQLTSTQFFLMICETGTQVSISRIWGIYSTGDSLEIYV